MQLIIRKCCEYHGRDSPNSCAVLHKRYTVMLFLRSMSWCLLCVYSMIIKLQLSPAVLNVSCTPSNVLYHLRSMLTQLMVTCIWQPKHQRHIFYNNFNLFCNKESDYEEPVPAFIFIFGTWKTSQNVCSSHYVLSKRCLQCFEIFHIILL